MANTNGHQQTNGHVIANGFNGFHKKYNVCVIGAGASGLCAARHLLEHPLDFSYDHFEMTSYLGGQWVFTNNDENQEDEGSPLFSCMYKNLW